MHAGDARDLLHVVALDLAVGDQLEAEVAVEGDRPVDVGDRQGEVVDACDQGRPLPGLPETFPLGVLTSART